MKIISKQTFIVQSHCFFHPELPARSDFFIHIMVLCHVSFCEKSNQLRANGHNMWVFGYYMSRCLTASNTKIRECRVCVFLVQDKSVV